MLHQKGVTTMGNNGKKSQVGYGSTYRRGKRDDIGQSEEIGSVLAGQVWLVKPDKKAQAANPCLWMQAGVVEFKACNNFYDCTSCKYDLGMRKQVQRGKQISWQDAMRSRPDIHRLCRHSLTNRIPSRACAYDYRCATCDFDQFFEDVWSRKTKSLPAGMHQVKGFDVPSSYYFHQGHGWARIESGGFIRVGLDDFTYKLLGRMDALELPLTGRELNQGTAAWGLRRDRDQAQVQSPVDGVVVDVNATLRDTPQLANTAPYSDGWLFTVHHPNLKKAMQDLMTDEASLDWISGEVATLERMIEDIAGPLAADGGLLQTDIYGNMPDLGWDKLTKTFLKTG
jgi:glycine cleavage system H lipoate-binding protein